MMDYYGDDDDDSMDNNSITPQTNFDGEEACGYPGDLIVLIHLHEPTVLLCLRKKDLNATRFIRIRDLF